MSLSANSIILVFDLKNKCQCEIEVRELISLNNVQDQTRLTISNPTYYKKKFKCVQLIFNDNKTMQNQITYIN